MKGARAGVVDAAEALAWGRRWSRPSRRPQPRAVMRINRERRSRRPAPLRRPISRAPRPRPLGRPRLPPPAKPVAGAKPSAAAKPAGTAKPAGRPSRSPGREAQGGAAQGLASQACGRQAGSQACGAENGRRQPRPPPEPASPPKPPARQACRRAKGCPGQGRGQIRLQSGHPPPQSPRPARLSRRGPRPRRPWSSPRRRSRA